MKALILFSALLSLTLWLLESYDKKFPLKVVSTPDLKTQRVKIYYAACNTKWTKTTYRKKK